MSDNVILDVSGLSVRFGGILALNNVTFQVAKGSITALIGPNGAGKTTVFNCLTGFYKATSGLIQLQKKDGEKLNIVKVLGEPFQPADLVNPMQLGSRLYYKMFGGTHLVTRAGLARTFQNIRLFPEMTALENLLVAQHMTVNRNVISGIFKLPGFRTAEKIAVAKAYEWLDIMQLTEDANRTAGQLPYGHQRRLEIARAMCTNPRLICLDEPAAGLNPQETAELSQLIRNLRDRFGVTVFVIEHDMSLVMDISEHIVVLNYGEVIADNVPAKIKEDPAVLTAYLGAEEESL